jgi:hypothetical protein
VKTGPSLTGDRTENGLGAVVGDERDQVSSPAR